MRMSQKEKEEEQSHSEKKQDIADDEHLLADLYSDVETKKPTPQPQSESPLEKKLSDRILILEKELKTAQDQVLRLQAEWENTRRRLERDVANAHKYGAERLVSELLPVMDSLMRALEGATADHPQIKTMKQGIELTIEMLSKVLEKHGIISILPKLGDVFDPAQHEAMSMQAAPDAKPHTILQVLQKGYALNGRVIRAAMVIVAS